MFKNWEAICQESDLVLRLLLATATDTRILEGLEKGFPEFFAADEQTLRVPHSSIKEWRDRGDASLTFPGWALEHFGIPHFTFDGDSGYPEGIVEKLGDKNIAINGEEGGGTWEKICFEWNGRPCLVAEYAPNSLLILVPQEFIDLSA